MHGRVSRRAAAWARLTAMLAAAMLAAATLAGCGGGSGSPTTSGAGAEGGAIREAQYTWAAPTGGSAPTVAAENARRGTVSWRLPGAGSLAGGRAGGAVDGYVARQAISPGQTQTVYVSAPGSRVVHVRVYRMGWYHGRGGRLILSSRALPAVAQPPCAHRSSTGLTECRWTPTLSFPIPSWLASGVYLVKLIASAGGRRDAIFVVRPASVAPVVVQIPTSTWEAYNGWGGDSLYPGGQPVVATGTTQGVEVSYDRPYESETGAGQFFIREVALVRWLERNGYAAGYTTDASVDADPGQLHGARAVIDAGHSEYWSPRQYAAFASARDAGSSLLFLSSDAVAWRVRYAPASASSSQSGEAAHRVISYKQYAAQDPASTLPTGLYPDGGARLTGSAYNGCITPRLPGSSPPVYRLYPWRPAPGLRPSWLFAGTGVSAYTSIPGIVGYELDQATPASPAGTLVVGGGSASCQPETEPSPVRGETAQSTIYETPTGGFVFASGTLGWLYGLDPVPEASPDAPSAPDPRVEAMTANLLRRALSR